MGANLSAVACFFQRPWSRLSPNLSAPAQAWLLNETAYYLQALGRLAEAVEPMRATLEMYIRQESWKNAAITASKLSELELSLGELSAVTNVAESVERADRSKKRAEMRDNRTTHADALHQSGQTDEVRRLFAKAEIKQAKEHPACLRLYSTPGFHYCDLLLSGAECAARQVAVDPGSQVLQISNSWIKPIRAGTNGASTTFYPCRLKAGHLILHAPLGAGDTSFERAPSTKSVRLSTRLGYGRTQPLKTVQTH